jgi:hypothetical protein
MLPKQEHKMTKRGFTLDEIHAASDFITQVEADRLASAKPGFTLDEIHAASDFITQVEVDRSTLRSTTSLRS